MCFAQSMRACGVQASDTVGAARAVRNSPLVARSHTLFVWNRACVAHNCQRSSSSNASSCQIPKRQRGPTRENNSQPTRSKQGSGSTKKGKDQQSSSKQQQTAAKPNTHTHTQKKQLMVSDIAGWRCINQLCNSKRSVKTKTHIIKRAFLTCFTNER